MSTVQLPSTPTNNQNEALPTNQDQNKNQPSHNEPSSLHPFHTSSPLQLRRGLNLLQPALIIPFAILGLLIRLGLNSIESFAGQQVFALVWPQFIGCLIMGCLVATRDWIEKGFGLLHYKGNKRGHWLGPFFYVALSSGLCGSITTFSSWSLGTFVELINPSRINRHPLQNILSALSELTVTLAMSLAGLELGEHLGQGLIWKVDSAFPGTREEGPGPSIAPETIEAVLAEEDTTAQAGTEGNTPLPGMDESSSSAVPQQRQQHQLSAAPATSIPVVTPSTSNMPIPLPKAPTYWTVQDWLLIVVCVALWLGTMFGAIWMPAGSHHSWRHVALATCFAPLGAILRWYISRWNAAGLKRWQFPVGTFSANIIGSIVLAAVICLEHSVAIQGRNGAAVACQVFSGLQDGFCGCLTTISTFALELKTLPRRASYIYGVISVVVAQLTMLIILGSFVWTQSSIKDQENGYNLTTCRM
ncbi:hypothetical protein BGZ83_004239 [Gryganskiella cystojenkinii]|nr:hypothetical protein BGZ83_004239 [Gryganskiella cystojenkinii]